MTLLNETLKMIRVFDLAQSSNDAINKMAANLEANTKSMDNLVALVTQK